MDFLFSPWRYRYLASVREIEGCIFCDHLAAADDAARLVLARYSQVAVVLNLYPYTNGHLMIFPCEHRAWLHELPAAAQQQMLAIAARAESALLREYRPDGVNVGMNLGEAAGAGIAGHLHLHVVPRWFGDSNFMTVVGETRVLPEDLSRTYQRLKPYFSE